MRKAPLILLVDDDRGLLRLMEKTLQREGLRTESASSGAEALGCLERANPELLLVDLKLPDRAGPEWIGELLRKKPGLPFIVITGQGDELAAVHTMKMGALEYLVKGNDFLDLLPAVVHRALEQIEQRRKLEEAEAERKRSERRLNALYAVTRILAGSSLFQEAAPPLLEAIGASLDWEQGEIWSVDPEANLLRCTAEWHLPSLSLSPGEFLPSDRKVVFRPDEGLPGRVWSSARPAWVADPAQTDFFFRRDQAAAMRAAVAVPIAHRKEIMGVLMFLSRSLREPDEYSLKMMEDIAARIGQFIDRKRLEQELLKISELEQRRIGQDLHDGLSQHLAGTELMSEALEQSLSKKNRPEAAQAAQIAEHVREAMAQTRALARGLFPVELEAHGLMSALEELAANTAKLFGVDCQFDCRQPVPVMNNVMATHLYRIAQEAVHNALKHGRANQIVVRLARHGEEACLSVQDNGRGINPEATAGRGMGLRIMKYRAGMIGGRLSIGAAQPQGTLAECFFKNI